MWKTGERFWIDGDVRIEDYNVRVTTNGTVEENQMPRKRKLLCALDSIDGEGNVCVRVNIKDMKPVRN